MTGYNEQDWTIRTKSTNLDNTEKIEKNRHNWTKKGQNRSRVILKIGQKLAIFVSNPSF